MCGLVGDASSAGPPPVLHWQVGVSPTGQSRVENSILTSLFGYLAEMILFLLVIIQMKLTC